VGRPKGSKNKPRVMIAGVPLGEIKKRRNLSGTWNFFGFDTKEEFDAADISDKRIVVEYMLPVSERKAGEERAKAEEAARALERYGAEGGLEAEIETNVESFEQKVEERVAQYLEDFDTSAKTDVDNLRNLASAQIRLEAIQEVRLYQMAKPVEQQITKIARDVFKALGEEEKALLQQVRLLQKGMGIDKPTREDKAAEVTGVDRVQAIVREAKEFLANEIVEINHCGVRVAWYARFFPEEPLFIRTKCPRCGEEIVYGDEGA